MQKALNFVKDAASGDYVAESTVNADYNVRLERAKGGSVRILQSTVQGKKHVQKDSIPQAGTNWEGEYDNLVYPKYVKVVSETPVTNGWITEMSI